MKAKCNVNTKKIVAFKRKGDFEIVESYEIVIDVDQMPDLELDRLNYAGDGIEWHTQADIDAQTEAKRLKAIDIELREIDLLSIRSIREYIVSQPGASQFIKDRETEAVNKRSERA